MTDIGIKSSSDLLYTGVGVVTGFLISCSSTTAATATLYDNTEASGTKILEVSVVAGRPVCIFFPPNHEPRFETGLYLELGSNLFADVWYMPG